MNQNGHRPRFTRSTVRTLDTDVLLEAYQRSHLYKRLVDDGLIEPTPIEKAKAKKQHGQLRAELIKRGFKREDLDVVPEIPEALQAEIDAMKPKVILTDQ